MRSAKHLEDLVETLLPDHVAHADDLGVLGRHEHGQITLRDLQPEVCLLDALEDPLFDGLDQRGPMMRVDNGLTDLESHVFVPLSTNTRVTRATCPQPLSIMS